MATYKVVDADQLNADMTSVADSIRTKGGTTGKLVWPDGYKTAIAAIQTGGGGGGGSEEEWIGDGNTHIWITLAEGRTSPMLGCCPKGTVTVDWGDGTTPNTLTGTSTSTLQWTPTHNYAAAGDYVITLTVDGAIGFFGSASANQYSGVLRYSVSSDVRNNYYRNAVKKIECGNGVTDINSQAFRSCYRLEKVKLANGVTKIGSNAWYENYSLVIASFPNSVTSISSSVLYKCYSLLKIRFNSTTPPTVSNSNAFTDIPADCVISVPVGSLSAYTSATNYPSSSTYTYIEED